MGVENDFKKLKEFKTAFQRNGRSMKNLHLFENFVCEGVCLSQCSVAVKDAMTKAALRKGASNWGLFALSKG